MCTSIASVIKFKFLREIIQNNLEIKQNIAMCFCEVILEHCLRSLQGDHEILGAMILYGLLFTTDRV